MAVVETLVMKRVFVTGGSGFVGRNLIGALTTDGIEVRALARSDAAARTVNEAGGKACRVELDDVDGMRAAMEGCDVVFHCAAKIDEWGDPREFHRINVEGTEAVLAAARAAGVPRLVHVSTEAVILDGTPIVDANEERPLPKNPIGSYARTKGLAEVRVRAANDDALTTVIVRPRFVWGKGDTAVLPRLVEAVQNGRFVWLSGGRYLTSTCHVRNLVHGMRLAAEKGRGGEIYFLTDGEPLAFREVITALLATRDVTPPEKNLPFFLAHAIALVGTGLYRLFGIHKTPPLPHATVHLIGETVTVDDGKARKELGYSSIISRAEGLAEMRDA